MPINPDLLIAAPMLQDLLVDKTGLAMAGGTITMYHDNSRTTLKNWYYQSGSPGHYTYIKLPNPLTLSAAGTITDINGVDTIPFYYPYDEEDETISDPYYVTIVNFTQTNQITRENFPYNRANTAPLIMTETLQNLIVNNGFWRNALPNYINSPSTVSIMLNTPFLALNADGNYAGIVAPSQHDGFSMPDIQFIKNNLSATDTCTFTPFPFSTSEVIKGTSTPEYYISHQTSAPGSAETVKCYQFPIALHLNNLSNLPFTVTIQAQNAGAATPGENILTLKLLQFTGTGTTSPNPTIIANQTITLSNTWQAYPLTSIFPSSVGLNLGSGEDDAWYLQVQMPLNLASHINFTKPALFLTDNVVPTNDFQTYDQVNAIISSPRTGDIKIGLNNNISSFTSTSIYSIGWVPLNGGTIGGPLSNASTRKNGDTFALFSLLWYTFNIYNVGTANPIAQMLNSAGTPVAYGGTPIADFAANNQLTLTQMMGKVILGTVPATVLSINYTTTFTATAGLITTANTVNYFNGMPVRFTGTGVLSHSVVSYVTNFNGTNQFNIASSFANAMAGTIIAFGNDSGVVVGANTGTFEGEYAHAQLVGELAAHTHPTLTVGRTFATVTTPGTGTYASTAMGSLFGSDVTTGSTGGGAAANVTQPGTFYNIYMKL